jgi:hypothetical protein
MRGTEKVAALFGLHVITYNLIRLSNPSGGDGGSLSSTLPRGLADYACKMLRYCPIRPNPVLRVALKADTIKISAFG